MANTITPDPTGDWFQDASESQRVVLRGLNRIKHLDNLDLRPGRESVHRSAQASFNDYETVPGVYRVLLSDLGVLDGYTSAQETRRIENLADAIRNNEEIEPVFVALDQEGLWLVEGQHRARALRLLGYDSVPAKIIVDLDNVPNLDLMAEASPKSPNVSVTQQVQEAREYLQNVAAVASIRPHV